MVSSDNFIGTFEQSLFSIEDNRERADKLQEFFIPKLRLLLEKACDMIYEVYGADSLSSCRITTTPAHRPGAKNTKPFEEVSAGLSLKGKLWYFQQRFECTVDGLRVVFFGLRGLEGNPIVQVMQAHTKEIIHFLEYGGYSVYSETIQSFTGERDIRLDELIASLVLVPEKEWKSTYIVGSSIALPIEELEAAQLVVEEFVALFVIFRAAANILLGQHDYFEKYLEKFWHWQNKFRNQGSKTVSSFFADKVDVLTVLSEFETPTSFFPDEVDSTQVFQEGAVRQVLVNAYERDPKARQKCIEYYGLSCVVCNFNFGNTFGDLGKGFIHVHHLNPISEVGEEYEVYPIRDLRPVCPNCHAMLHRRSPPLTIEEIRVLLNSNHERFN